ncbi:hypothetical protein [Galliscardovia ingluviei]|nr:hypothetical protein [Galliscardovia ingluviei]
MLINQAIITPYIPDGYTLAIEERNNGNTSIDIEREYSTRMKYLLTITVNGRQIIQYLGFAVHNLRDTPARMNNTLYAIGNWIEPLEDILPRIKQAIAYLEQEQIRQAFRHLI